MGPQLFLVSLFRAFRATCSIQLPLPSHWFSVVFSPVATRGQPTRPPLVSATPTMGCASARPSCVWTSKVAGCVMKWKFRIFYEVDDDSGTGRESGRFSSTMTFKRRNGGKNRCGRGHVKAVHCSNCKRLTPKVHCLAPLSCALFWVVP